jgi:hypothetical protein
MYFSGKAPLIVAGTTPPVVSSGLGVTVKLSADKAPNLPEQAVRSNNDAAKRERISFRIIDKFKKVPRAGLEPAQPLLAKGF